MQLSSNRCENWLFIARFKLVRWPVQSSSAADYPAEQRGWSRSGTFLQHFSHSHHMQCTLTSILFSLFFFLSLLVEILSIFHSFSNLLAVLDTFWPLTSHTAVSSHFKARIWSTLARTSCEIRTFSRHTKKNPRFFTLRLYVLSRRKTDDEKQISHFQWEESRARAREKFPNFPLRHAHMRARFSPYLREFIEKTFTGLRLCVRFRLARCKFSLIILISRHITPSDALTEFSAFAHRGKLQLFALFWGKIPTNNNKLNVANANENDNSPADCREAQSRSIRFRSIKIV